LIQKNSWAENLGWNSAGERATMCKNKIDITIAATQDPIEQTIIEIVVDQLDTYQDMVIKTTDTKEEGILIYYQILIVILTEDTEVARMIVVENTGEIQMTGTGGIQMTEEKEVIQKI